MSFAPESAPLAPEALAKPETLLRVPVGLASPLWGLFAGAAVSGAAWWWMTRWTRPQNLEAMFGAAGPLVDAAPEPALEALAEAAPEPVAETLAEATPEPVAEPPVEIGEPDVVAAPQALEAAAEPIAEPAEAAKARKKAAAPPASDAPD